MSYEQIATLLREWPNNFQQGHTPVDTAQERLYGALHPVMTGERALPGPNDLAVLIRDVLRRESERCEDPTLSLWVPRASGWPTREVWAKSSCELVDKTENAFRIEAKPWVYQEHEALRPLVAKKKRRREDSPEFLAADPAVAKVSYPTYRSEAQGMAVRSIFLSKPGASILVNLPTGAGKSLAAYAPAFVNEGLRQFSLVVVPTISLALDQERQVKELVGKQMPSINDFRLAWHSGLAQETRHQIKQDIKAGRQPILFASPESICGTLAGTLFRASEEGLLRYFIVDEAHMIRQWGTGFRLEFQSMAGLRMGLLAACTSNGHEPFRTILMSATVTEETYQLLNLLYSKPHPLESVAAVQLRPEPTYWMEHFRDADAKRNKEERVLELLRHAPRPAILYVTTPAEVREWRILLAQDGFSRVDSIDGKTTPAEREKVITRWTEREIDLMVATSAFGLGMDQSDVRVVVHACYPDSVDRFYQEVGRGGRDGYASASFLFYTDEDRRLGEKLGKNSNMIGPEKAKERWDMLYKQRADRSADGLGEDVYQLDLSLVPGRLPDESDLNVFHNLTSVLFLVQTEVVELLGERPDFGGDDVTSEERKRRFDQFCQSVTIRILASDHRSEPVWNQVAELRRALMEDDRSKAQRMRSLTSATTCMAETLSDVYRINSLKLAPRRYCSGCPGCRQAGRDEVAFAYPTYLQSVEHTALEAEKLSGLTHQAMQILVYDYDAGVKRAEIKWRKRVLKPLVERLVSWGIREVVADASLRTVLKDLPAFVVFIDSAKSGSSLTTSEPEPPLNVPRLSILGPDWSDAIFPEELLESDPPGHIVLMPNTVRDLTKPQNLYTSLHQYQDHVSFMESLL